MLRRLDSATALDALRTAALAAGWRAEREDDPDEGSLLRLYPRGRTPGTRGELEFCVGEGSRRQLSVTELADCWLGSSASAAGMRRVLGRLREVTARMPLVDRGRIRLRIAAPRRPRPSRTVAPLLEVVIRGALAEDGPRKRRLVGSAHWHAHALYALCAQVARTGAALDAQEFARRLRDRNVSRPRVKRLAYLYAHLIAFASRGHRAPASRGDIAPPV